MARSIEFGGRDRPILNLAGTDRASLQTAVSVVGLLKKLVAWLRKYGLNGDTLAYPVGTFNAAVEVEVLKNFASARTTVGGVENAAPLRPGRLRCYFLAPSTTFAQVKTYIDSAQADGAHIIIGMHDASTSPSATQIDIALVQQVSNYLNTVGMPVRTVSQVHRAAQDAPNSLANVSSTVASVGAGLFAPLSDHTKIDFTQPKNGLALPATSRQTFSRFSPMSASATSLMTSGRLHLTAVWHEKGDVISGARWVASTAPVTPTHAWAALFDQNRNQLAVSADTTSTAWGSSQPFAFTAPYTVTTAGWFYYGLCVVAATMPAFYVVAHPGTTAWNLVPLMNGSADTGLTTPATCPATAAALTAVNGAPYILTN